MDFLDARIDDREKLLEFFPKGSEAATNNFTNLFIWQGGYNIKFAVEDGFLFIKGEFKGKTYFFFPMGSGDLCSAVKKIIEMSDGECRFYQLLKDDARFLKKNFGFDISEDRNSWEYVYETEKLINLSGKHLHAKKNHYNSFVKEYKYRYEPITSDNLNLAEEFALSMIEGFERREQERISIKKLFGNFERLGVFGAILFVGKEVAAVTAGEKITKETALIHIEKADTRFKGSYAAINKMFAENALADTIYINREEDMGIEGLRQAKTSYQPARFIKKYIGVLKNES